MWLTLAVGVVLGYFFATSPLPLAVWSVVADIPRVENKVPLLAVVGGIVGLFCVILAVLDYLARKERAGYENIDESVKTTFLGNLRRRGSLSNNPELEIVRDTVDASIKAATAATAAGGAAAAGSASGASAVAGSNSASSGGNAGGARKRPTRP